MKHVKVNYEINIVIIIPWEKVFYSLVALKFLFFVRGKAEISLFLSNCFVNNFFSFFRPSNVKALVQIN